MQSYIVRTRDADELLWMLLRSGLMYGSYLCCILNTGDPTVVSTLRINDCILPTLNSCRDLGVITRSTLTFTEHIYIVALCLEPIFVQIQFCVVLCPMTLTGPSYKAFSAVSYTHLTLPTIYSV